MMSSFRARKHKTTEAVKKAFTVEYDFQTLRGDVFGGITAAVVGLPIALAFGVASGLGPMAGMYGAIAVGFFAAVFGGTRSQISGPTGPMAVAMAVIVTTHASGPVEAFTIAIMAGVIQMFLGITRVGRFVAYTPYSVISGFMSGIGVIIILVQSLPFLGASHAEGGPLAVIGELPAALTSVNLSAVAIAGATLLVAIIWPTRIRHFFPPTLAALVVGAVIGVFWLTGTPVIGDVPTGLPSLILPELSPAFLLAAIPPAITIALLGSIDSLLTSLIADSISRDRHKPNRELFGQGIGNVAAAFIGGIPGAGNTLGTVVNIRAGGRTQLSGALCAAILLILVLGLGKYVEAIPHAVLAGILMKVGWDIIDWRFLTRLHRVQPEHLLIMFITLTLTVFLDLITAVAIGLIAAGMASARQFERMELDSVVSVPLLDQTFLFNRDTVDTEGSADDDGESIDPYSARVGMVALRGSFSVASSGKLINAISADISEHEVVILDFSSTVYIDDSAALVVEQMIDAAYDQDTECIVMGLAGLPAASLYAMDVLRRVPADCRVANLDEAREVALRLLTT